MPVEANHRGEGYKLNLAVLISGRGSNLQSLIDHCAHDDFPARISVVISNRPDAKGLNRAEAAGIATRVVDHKDYASKADFETDLLAALDEYPVELVCLAGFMRILSADFIERWSQNIINIHPSLLPDYKGLDTHERVIADGKPKSGCTVHYVTPEMDDGPIILQAEVPVYQNDSPDQLAERVLEQEHLLYPAAVKRIAKERLKNDKRTA